MESVMLAPQAEVNLYPWKEPKDRIPLAVRHIGTFLRAHQPATAHPTLPAVASAKKAASDLKSYA
jgi:hypothetical protein